MNIYYEPVNLNHWNIFEQVKQVGHIEPFLATKSMKTGDLVLLHVGQQCKRYHSGIYAVGEIVVSPYILTDRPDDYCNNRLTVDVKILKINYSAPFITHEDTKEFVRQFRTVHKVDPQYYAYIFKLIQ